jgi:hypothetical protein
MPAGRAGGVSSQSVEGSVTEETVHDWLMLSCALKLANQWLVAGDGPMLERDERRDETRRVLVFNTESCQLVWPRALSPVHTTTTTLNEMGCAICWRGTVTVTLTCVERLTAALDCATKKEYLVHTP